MRFCPPCCDCGPSRRWGTKRPGWRSVPKLLFLGIDNSGKTSAIRTLLRPPAEKPNEKDEPAYHVAPQPTDRITKYTLKVANQDFVAVDMPGTLNQRVSWVAEIEKANGVVFFVDSTDEMRFSVACRELLLVCLGLKDKPHSRIVPLLVFATKQDVRSAHKAKDVFRGVHLDETSCNLAVPWSLRACSALDYRSIHDGVRWLLKEVKALKALSQEELKQAAARYQVANERFYYSIAPDGISLFP